MADVQVNLPETSYTVRVEPGLIHRVGAELRALSRSSKTVIVTDQNLADLHLPALVRSLSEADFAPIVAVLPTGEQHKTLADLQPIFDTALSARIERTTPLLALGGGIVGDMAGFAAATLLRGIPFVQIPTTLLAMVDASVGGKTGVNHSAGKNLIGAFHQPIAVYADPQLLQSLPRDEFIGGLAECIKHDIIRDAEGFAHLEHHLNAILHRDLPLLTELVAHNIRIKARVVEADPFEHGERAHLNFGHTFAHAIEKATHHAISHGHAVGLGMIAACSLATQLDLLDADSNDRIVKLIERTGLPVKHASLNVDAIVTAMSFDKKVKSSKIRFILPDRIGHVVIRDDVPAAMITAAVQSIV